MTRYAPENPSIVQGDHTVLLEVDSPRYEAARDGLARFAELIKSPEHIQTYRITPLSIWNACAAGTTTDEIADSLHEFSKYDIPGHVLREIRVLAVSKVANFAVDLPDAAVAIQISGTFGSRQEEAQQLGRILRPKAGRNQAHFYTLVSGDTVEQEFATYRGRPPCTYPICP